jgi:KDO2-lipid IV(A) lauroyltransferase
MAVLATLTTTLNTGLQRFNLGLMKLLGRLPLRGLRALGWLVGRVLYAVVVPRRRIALTNWRLCFPELTEVQRRRAVKAHFVAFAQSWLDRSWLWEASPEVVASRLRLTGAVSALDGDTPTVLFAPHFVGLDAGWTALTLHSTRTFCTLYAPQKNVVMDGWIAQGRRRFGAPQVVAKYQGAKPVVAAIREGQPLYLLPDMDQGMGDAVWATLFGQPAATLTSLPRMARLGRAQVLAVTSRITPSGYDVEIHPAWRDYPTSDLAADVQRMNHELEHMIEAMPEQYYWVHKRFKTRPPGQPSVYAR